MLALLLAIAPLQAPCPLPAGMEGWATMTPLAAGDSNAKAPALTIGRGAAVTLKPVAAVAFAPPLTRPAGAGRHGGVFAVTVATAGRYRVALGGAAWVDLIRDGRAVASAAHGHGPACSSARKMVDYDLRPGRYRFQVSNSAAATLPMMVARLP